MISTYVNVVNTIHVIVLQNIPWMHRDCISSSSSSFVNIILYLVLHYISITLHAEDVFCSQETADYLYYCSTDFAMKNLPKPDIEKLIKHCNPSISYVKPKKASGEHWCNYSQVYVNCIAQNYVCCSSCENLLAWKTGDGSTNLKKHSQYCHGKNFGNQ